MYGWKSVIYDNRRGLLLFFLICVTLFSGIRWQCNGMNLTIGDVLLICWYGREPIRHASMRELLDIPGIWFFLHSFLYMVLLSKPQKRLYQNYMITVRLRSRCIWWRSLVLWLLGSEILYYACFLISICLVNWKSVFNDWNPHTTNEISNFSASLSEIGSFGFTQEYEYWIFWVRVLVFPILVGFTINFLQLTLSLFMRVELSILLSFSYMFASLYGSGWWFVGNGTMLVRSELVGYSNQTLGTMCMCLGICGFCYCLGCWRIRRMNILQKGRI